MDRLNCGLIELKTAGSASDMTFSGYGAVFNNVDGGGDLIEPGAFAAFLSDVKSGKQDWPAMLSQHGGYGMTAEDMTPIGVWTDFAEDGHGLKVSGQLADTPRGREMYALMKMAPRPAINGMSIGYIAKEAIPRSSPDEPRRRLKRIDLVEVSMVTRPMNGKARVTSVKSGDMSERDFERLLTRDAGFTRSEALLIMSEGFKSYLAKRDAGAGELQEVLAALRQRETIFA